MPSRLIREGILTSERVDALDPASEVFYRRLMSKVDDHGLFDARASILRASLYPLRVDRVREADISRWIATCEKAGLIALYQHDGKPYLQMLDTRWPARSEPKYPRPPESNGDDPPTTVSNCKQSQTPVVLDVVVGEGVEDYVPSERKRVHAKKTRLPDDFGLSDRVMAWATEHGYSRLDEHLEHFVGYAKANGKTYQDWDQALMNAIRGNWAKVGAVPIARAVGSTRSRSLVDDLTDRSWAER